MSSLKPGDDTRNPVEAASSFLESIRDVMQKRKAPASPNTRPHTAMEASIGFPCSSRIWYMTNTKITRTNCSIKEETAGMAAFFMP